MSGEVNRLKQELAYQTGRNDGIREGGMGCMGGPRGYFGRGMDFASSFCGSFMGSCAANMANCFRGFGGIGGFGGFGFSGGFGFGGGFGRGFGW